MGSLTPLVQHHFPRFYKWLTLRMVRQRFEDSPFTALEKPLSRCRFALVTTGGFHLESQPPFQAKRIDECSFREIPTDTPAGALRIAHEHYDHGPVKKDLNVLLPRDRMKELVQEKAIGALCPVMISFMGAILKPKALLRETASQAARRLKQLDVDCVLLTPA